MSTLAGEWDQRKAGKEEENIKDFKQNLHGEEGGDRRMELAQIF